MIKNVKIDELHAHPDNPRKDLGDLSELTASIKANGIFQNLTAVPREEGGYTVIIGHRRLAAAKAAGLETVPCAIVKMDQKTQLETMLIENMQREDLTVYEQAQSFQMMLDLGSTVDEISEKTGFSKATVKRRVKMAELDPKKLKEVSGRQLNLADFDELAKIKDLTIRNKALEYIGTDDFEMEVKKALKQEKINERLPEVMARLAEVGAKEIQRSDTWSGKYDRYETTGWKDVSIIEFGNDGNTIPDPVDGVPMFYCFSYNGDAVGLYMKKKKAEKEKVSPEEQKRLQEAREAWKEIKEVSARAYELRKAFVEKLKVGSHNLENILTGAIYALGDAAWYSRIDIRKVEEILGIESYKYSEQVSDKLPELSVEKYAELIYLCFDDKATPQTTQGDNKQKPRFYKCLGLRLLYKWLGLLGYRMSREELAMMDGTHPAYFREEKKHD